MPNQIQATNAERVANNVVLLLVSRFAMILAASALPVGGWMLQRAVASVDRLSDKVDALRDQMTETGGTIRLVQQTQALQSGFINDHEARMRLLERRTN